MKRLSTFAVSCLFSFISHADITYWTHSVEDTGAGGKSLPTKIDAEFFKTKLVTIVYFVDENFNSPEKSFQDVGKGLLRSAPAVHTVFVVRTSTISEEDFPAEMNNRSAAVIKDISMYLRGQTTIEKNSLEISEDEKSKLTKAQILANKQLLEQTEKEMIDRGVKSIRESLHFVYDGDGAISQSFGIKELSPKMPYALMVIDSEARVISTGVNVR